MNVDEQRKLGVRLAREHNAPETLKVIKNTQSTYPEIIRTAAAELGPQRLAEIVLEQNDPEWAMIVLNDVDDLGASREKLHALASQLHVNMARPAASSAAIAVDEMPKIGNFYLTVKLGASFSANFTMYWSPVTSVQMPVMGYPGTTPPYQWSSLIRVAQSDTKPCSYFALPQAKLNTGDIVWMVVSVHGSGWYETEWRFIYDGSAATASIEADGGLVSPSFTLLGVS